MPCPAFSGGHPACECSLGYRGTITLDPAAQQYNGQCELEPCPLDFSRRTAVVNATALILRCGCYTGCAGGYDWFVQGYEGSCTCVDCPARGHCAALTANPKTAQTVFPCNKGFQGCVWWDGRNWVDECKLVACPANSDGHPGSQCKPGFRGSVTASQSFTGNTTAFFHTSTCTLVP